MATLVRMPSVLAGAEEGTVAGWLVAEGDTVAVGDTIAEIETDKASVDYQAETAGVVGRLLAEPGTVIPVGEPMLVLLEAGEDADAALRAAGGDGARPAEAAPADSAPASAPTELQTAGLQAAGPQAAGPLTAHVETAGPAAAAATPQEAARGTGVAVARSGGGAARLFASPVARKLARENGLELNTLAGSGPHGRITRRDVAAALQARPAGRQAAPAVAAAPAVPEEGGRASGPAAAPTATVGSGTQEGRLVPHTAMRRTIARRLTLSQSTIPQFQLVAECVVDDLLALRAEINAQRDGRALSVNDFVVKAVAGALGDVPEANVTWRDDGMIHHSRADIAVAVATEGGLVTPVVRDAGARSVSEIGRRVSELAQRAREKRLGPDEIDGGTFTVSNLGMYGTAAFSAIVNPPHWGILAVGAARPAPVVTDGALRVARVMSCTLSVDHRAVDGALAARWLAAFQHRIEKPLLILA